jgi:hypothetical protein
MLGIVLHAPRGPFYSPKVARSRWRSNRKTILAFGRVVHRTVRCTTGHEQFLSGAWSPSFFWRSRPLGLWSRWRTGQSGVTIRPLAQPRVACWSRRRPLAHRTVQWIIDATPSLFPESSEFAVGPAWAPDSPAHHKLELVWLNIANSSPLLFLFSWQCL